MLLACLLSARAQAQTIAPFCIGETLRIHSDTLGEDRSINIYLPPDYRESDTTRYHVIYLLDGSADEDFLHVAGLVQFYTFPWVQRLPPTIVIGIANVDRRRDFTFASRVAAERNAYPTTGHSARFTAFLGSELIPHVEKTYRCSGSRTLIGQSLGGLLAAEILRRQPAMFSRYLVISPSLWWDSGSSLRAAYGPFRQQTDVFVAVGKEGLVPGSRTRTMEGDARAFTETLRGLRDPRLRVSFSYLPDEDHAGIAHQAIMNGIRKLFPQAGSK